MKRIKIALTGLTLALALTGVLVVKANEKKRTTTKTGFFSNSAGTVTITVDKFVFDDASITTNASIKDNTGTDIQIFKNSNLTGNLRLIP